MLELEINLKHYNLKIDLGFPGFIEKPYQGSVR